MDNNLAKKALKNTLKFYFVLVALVGTTFFMGSFLRNNHLLMTILFLSLFVVSIVFLLEYKFLKDIKELDENMKKLKEIL